MTNVTNATFARPDGRNVSGYVASPAAGAAAGSVVVIQEWWGLNEQIRGVCDRLAHAGFRALAPDLYDGYVAPTAEAASKAMTALDTMDALEKIRGAAQHLTRLGGRVASLGFCMGGALSLASAVHVPELSAAVVFYGIPPAEKADPSRIGIPVLLHFANRDDWCTPTRVNDLERKLKSGHVPFELHRYDAQHAFANERRPEVHDPAATKLAWERSIAFLRKHLG